MSVESVMLSNRLILSRPLLLLPSIFPSIKVFSSESAIQVRWPKYWSFSFSISPSNGHSGLISFRMDWLDLLVHLVTFFLRCSHCTCPACCAHRGGLGTRAVRASPIRLHKEENPHPSLSRASGPPAAPADRAHLGGCFVHPASSGKVLLPCSPVAAEPAKSAFSPPYGKPLFS